MKYVVRVDGRELEIESGSDGLVLAGKKVSATLTHLASRHEADLRVGGRVYRLTLAEPGARRGEITLWVNGERFIVSALDERAIAIEKLTAATAVHRAGAALVAPMPGLILRVNVAAGDLVTAGQGLVVMEAMKMENELRAPGAGVVSKVHVEPGRAVEKGMRLIELE